MQRITALLFLVLPLLSHSQLQIGETLTIQSSWLAEERVLNIYTPEGYSSDSTQTYRVVYLLDGSEDEDFLHIVGLFQFMHMYEIMEPSILVGISNVDRYRDFTYPSSDPEDLELMPTSGGSAAFSQFMEFEVQPLIESRYQTSGIDAIIGQSMGGLYASEVLLKKPTLFDEYIIVSPSLWWDQQRLLSRADSLVNTQILPADRIFVSLGTEHPIMHEVAEELVHVLEESPLQQYELVFHPLPDEDHATILHFAVYYALRIDKLDEE